MKFQKYVAELLGTFILALAVSLSIISKGSIPTPVVAGLTLALLVYTLGGISGAHLNPAVTISLATIKKISPKDATIYVVMQFIGGCLALLASTALMGKGTGLADFPSDSINFATALVEALGTFMLVFGVSSVVHKKVGDEACGFVIGGSLFLGIMLTAGLSFGVLNPAVAVGLGLAQLPVYLLAPIVGGIIAAWTYNWLAEKPSIWSILG